MKILFALLFPALLWAQNEPQFAVLKYNGGGDWYANPTSLTNLISFCNKNLKTDINPKYATVEVGSSDIFKYPFLHMTGHGNVVFSEAEKENLTTYLKSGGFLHIDDNYGMDKFIRPQLEQLFANTPLQELGVDNPLFTSQFIFKNGLPKIHEHDGKRAQAFGLYYEGRLVLLYTYECDLGDGWEDKNVHNDSDETREKALKMGANIVNYIFTGQ